MPPLFDHHVIVDWSAASQKRRGRDSIWICHLGPDGEQSSNPDTRHSAKQLLAEILAIAVRRGERVLLGFDFPFGYPAGLAARRAFPTNSLARNTMAGTSAKTSRRNA